MVISVAVSLAYGWILAAYGWAEFRRTGNRLARGGGFGLGGLAILGAILRLSGDPAGRGLSLVAGILGLLVAIWILSRCILENRRPGRIIILGSLSLVLVLAALFLDVPEAHGAPVVPPAPAVQAATAAVPRGIEEASGVRRDGDRLLIVGDHEAGTFYSCPVPRLRDGMLPLEPERLSRHRIASGVHGIDLEAIGVLADDRIVVLSERLAALLDEKTIVCTYDHSLAEFGGRGLEGLAVRDLGAGRSRVAVLWEGGYPEPKRLPEPVRKKVCDRALPPIVLVHDIEPGDVGLRMRSGNAPPEVELSVPRPKGREPWAQRFRTPDLVWYRGERNGETEWGFLVLMSSGRGRRPGPEQADAECPKTEGGRPLKYCWRRLQRFDLQGHPWGEPYDLDVVLPPALRTANLEGMDWFEEGESLVLVYDEKIARRRLDPQVAVVVPLPEDW